MGPINALIAHRAARQLQRIAAKVTPQLSDDAVISRVTDRCREALDRFVTTHRGVAAQ
jgi:hypothetical protein